ncbi:MAG: hypothetical protein KDA80_00165 [Planctomycetaceae bacterium]|nr:hypothetical protein [Planctomycetaceae bacterium]
METDTVVPSPELTAIHDPVPSSCESGVYGGEYSPAHQLEIDVQRALLDLPDVSFSSLRVHRLADGICLTGMVRCSSNVRDKVPSLAAQIAGVDRVLNRLVIQDDGEGSASDDCR